MPVESGNSARRAVWSRALPWLASLAVVAATVWQLRHQGRLWWCACGRWYPFSADAYGPHNSQHLFDPYSLTHVLHGFAFWWLLAWPAPRLAPAWRLWVATVLESSWELAENPRLVIERYRSATASL